MMSISLPARFSTWRLWLLGGLLLLATGAQAQAGLRLPADLFVLTNAGRVERYDLAASGAQPVTPEAPYVIDFGIDPAGERIAYRTEEGIFLALLATPDADPIPLEGPSAGVPAYRGRGSTIAWSPDGRVVAYTTLVGARAFLDDGRGGRFADITDGIFTSLNWSPGGSYLIAETAENVWWVYQRSDDGLTLTSIIASSLGTAWVSDSEIVFAPETGGLKLMNLATANAQTTLLSEDLEYRLPFLTYDDRLVFFTRDPRDASTPSGYGVLRSLARGATTVETLGQPVPLAGLTWAPGGTLLVALQGGALGLLDPTTGAGVPFSINNAVAYSWGRLELVRPPVLVAQTPTPTPTLPPLVLPTAAPLPTDGTTEANGQMPTSGITLPGFEAEGTAEAVAAISLSAPLFFLNADAAAAATTGSIPQIWLLPSDGRPAFRFTGAIAPIREYAVSPDGRAVAYVSGEALWVQRLEVRQPFVVAQVEGYLPITPTFSPDGTRIAYAETTDAARGIWVAAFDGSAPVQVLGDADEAATPARSFQRPRWSPDGTRLLLDGLDAATGALTNVVYTLADRTLTQLPSGSAEDASAVTTRWRRDGRLLTLVTGLGSAAGGQGREPGLYSIDPTIISASSPVEWLPIPREVRVLAAQDIDAGRVRVLLTQADGPTRVVDLAGVEQRAVTAIAPELAASLALSTGSASFSPDARFLSLLSGRQVDTTGTISGEIGSLLILDLQRGGIFSIAGAGAVTQVQWANS